MRCTTYSKGKNIMLVKAHRTPDGKKIVAICDREILGKKFEENDLQLDLTGTFYKGKEMNSEGIKRYINEAYIINAVGEESVSFCIREKMITRQDVMRITRIPHAQVLVVRE